MNRFLAALSASTVAILASSEAALADPPTFTSSDFGRALATICLPVMRDGVSFDTALANAGVDESRKGRGGGYLVGPSGLVEVAYQRQEDGCEIRLIARVDIELPTELKPSSIQAEVSAIGSSSGFRPSAQAMPPGEFASRQVLCAPPDGPQYYIVTSATADDRSPGRLVFTTVGFAPERSPRC